MAVSQSYSPFRPVAKRIMSDPDAIARLCALILADEDLADQLASIEDRPAFAAAATDHARTREIRVSPEDVEAAARRDVLGLERFADFPITATAWPGRKWLPVAIVSSGGQPAVEWLHFGDAPLTDSFFESSIRGARRRPINSLVRVCTPLSLFLTRLPDDAASQPDGLIFHMSRCGSTLTAQMLSAIPGLIVASEPEPLDWVVQFAQTNTQIPFDQRITLLRAMAAMLGRDRFGDRHGFVIKTDSWHTLALPLFRAAFPDTPWLYLFRDPTEVMVSQVRARGSQTVPGVLAPAIFDIPDPLAVPETDYIAQVLARVSQAAIDHAKIGGGLYVAYEDLPEAVDGRVLPHFMIAPDERWLRAVRDKAQWDAKTPSFVFAPDSDDKRAHASESVRNAVARYLQKPHDDLTALARTDRIRSGQSWFDQTE